MQMKKVKNGLRLGIDIDGTITDPTTFIPYLNRAFRKRLTFDQVTEYDLAQVYGIDKEIMDRWFNHNVATIYANSPLLPEAYLRLKEWEPYHQLIFISARDQNHAPLTKRWLQQHQIPYDDLECIGSHNKIETAKAHQVDIFFEDKYDNAVDLAEALDIPVFLFDTPYNQGPLPKQVQRVSSWHDVQLPMTFNPLLQGQPKLKGHSM
ncbi:5' nucleotidase, NT5C type [Rubeoparvulum massiliense]|uniref:5' nucleotidase, NT5C type n=1 Tax=Rubeoparvulum massiliense TaxID=1631346 RepID=UPI000A7A9A0B|nr:hypothetical protein [Rubeoparvulum massiliense]